MSNASGLLYRRPILGSIFYNLHSNVSSQAPPHKKHYLKGFIASVQENVITHWL